MECKELSIRQKKFADCYLINGNATQSYIEAGYNVKSRESAEANGCRLIRNDKIVAYIQGKGAEINSSRVATMQEVHEYWTATMRDISLEPKDRIRASELIARMNGAFLDRVEHSGKIDTPVNIIITGDEE